MGCVGVRWGVWGLDGVCGDWTGNVAGHVRQG